MLIKVLTAALVVLAAAEFVVVHWCGSEEAVASRRRSYGRRLGTSL